MQLKAKFSVFILLLASSFTTIKGQEASQEKQNGPETIAISSINHDGTLYFKAHIQGLEKDMQLILEKEVPGKEEPTIVEVQEGVGTQAEMPILYCFKDDEFNSDASFYRLRGLYFEKGKAHSIVIAEKRFEEPLLSRNEK